MADICRCCNSTSGSFNTIPTVHTVQILWIQISISESQLYSGKLLILNKTAESIPPTLAQPMTEFGEMTFEMFNLKIIQLVLIVMAFTLTCYLLIRMTFWLFDYINTNFLNINSTGLTYLNSLTMDKTNIYLQFSDFTTGECANL